MRRAHGSITDLGDGRFKITVTIGNDPKTGKQRRKSRTVRQSRSKAELTLAAMLTQVGKADAVEDVMTLDIYWEEIYFPSARQRLRPTTVHGYLKNYNHLIKDNLGGYLLSQLTPPIIDTWLNGIDGKRKRLEAYRMLRIILNRAVKSGLLAYNPLNQVDVPKVKAYRPDRLSREAVGRYIELCRGTRAEPIVLLALGGGFRREEIAALDWEDISESGTVNIDNALTVAFGERYDDATKSEFGERRVHLPAYVTERLNELRGSGPLYTFRGRRVGPDSITRIYGEFRDSLPDDVQRITLKNLRHTSLSLTLEAGADLLAVSRRAGHSTVAVTAKYYLRPDESIDKSAAAGLDNILRS